VKVAIINRPKLSGRSAPHHVRNAPEVIPKARPWKGMVTNFPSGWKGLEALDRCGGGGTGGPARPVPRLSFTPDGCSRRTSARGLSWELILCPWPGGFAAAQTERSAMIDGALLSLQAHPGEQFLFAYGHSSPGKRKLRLPRHVLDLGERRQEAPAENAIVPGAVQNRGME